MQVIVLCRYIAVPRLTQLASSVKAFIFQHVVVIEL